MVNQHALPVDLPPAVAAPKPRPTLREEARVLGPVRNQVGFVPRTLDEAVAEDHHARSIWAYLQKTDLSQFYAEIQAVLGGPGRPTTDPAVLMGLWVLATIDGVGSARHLARLCESDDAYRWMAGGAPINYHMLADFRVAREEALNDLLEQISATMIHTRLVDLGRVAQDGTRIRASAGSGSFRTERTLDECLQEARAQVTRLAAEREHPDPGVTRRQQAARERAARERQQRLEQALRELPIVQAAKDRQLRARGRAREEVTEAKVSTTDPEARVMRMADGGFRPAYNVQFATDAGSQVIVGVTVTARGTDQGEALPMLEQVMERTGQRPGAYLMDGGYLNLAQITAIEQQGIAVYAPLRPPRRTEEREPQTPRPSDSPEVAAWRARMATPEGKAIYKERAATAECVNAQVKGRHKLTQFLVRGTAKVTSVALLMAISHDLMRWIALDH